jgi:hypothetical protein
MTAAPNKREAKRSDRWIDGVKELADRRGDSEAVWRRAVDITRQFNIAPWIALGVAERIVALKDAPVLDRAARCGELQAAVLDKRKTLDELKTSMPYAAYLLAVELVDLLGRENWELRKVTAVSEGLLNEERKLDEQGLPLPVRTRPLADYAAAVRRVRRLVERTGCSLAMAIDVETGRLTEAFVEQYVRQRRKLVREEMGIPGPKPAFSRPGFASHPRDRADARRRPMGRPRPPRDAGFPAPRPENRDARTPGG